MKLIALTIWMLIPFHHSLCFKFEPDFRNLYKLETSLMKDLKVKSIKKEIKMEGNDGEMKFLSYTSIGTNGKPLFDSSSARRDGENEYTLMNYDYSEDKLVEMRVKNSEEIYIYSKSYFTNDSGDIECSSVSGTAEPRRFKYIYDSEGRISVIEGYTFYPVGDSTDYTREWVKVETNEYAYDPKGNLTSDSFTFSDNSPNVTRFEYNERGFIKSIKWYQSQPEPEITADFEYAKNGLIMTEKLKTPDGDYDIEYSYEFYK